MSRIFLNTNHTRLLSPIPGYSSSQLLLDGLVEGLTRQASDLRNLSAMSVGSLAFSLTRNSSLVFLSRFTSSHALIQSASWTTALIGEVSAFRMTTQTLNRDIGESWSDRRAFLGTIADFACLKGVGYFLRSENVFLRHNFQALGMILGESVTQALGLRDLDHSSFGVRYAHALSTSFALEVGGHITHISSGSHLRSLERSLEHSRQLESARHFSDQNAFTTSVVFLANSDDEAKRPTVVQEQADEILGNLFGAAKPLAEMVLAEKPVGSSGSGASRVSSLLEGAAKRVGGTSMIGLLVGISAWLSAGKSNAAEEGSIRGENTNPPLNTEVADTEVIDAAVAHERDYLSRFVDLYASDSEAALEMAAHRWPNLSFPYTVEFIGSELEAMGVNADLIARIKKSCREVSTVQPSPSRVTALSPYRSALLQSHTDRVGQNRFLTYLIEEPEQGIQHVLKFWFERFGYDVPRVEMSRLNDDLIAAGADQELSDRVVQSLREAVQVRKLSDLRMEVNCCLAFNLDLYAGESTRERQDFIFFNLDTGEMSATSHPGWLPTQWYRGSDGKFRLGQKWKESLRLLMDGETDTYKAAFLRNILEFDGCFVQHEVSKGSTSEICDSLMGKFFDMQDIGSDLLGLRARINKFAHTEEETEKLEATISLLESGYSRNLALYFWRRWRTASGDPALRRRIAERLEGFKDNVSGQLWREFNGVVGSEFSDDLSLWNEVESLVRFRSPQVLSLLARFNSHENEQLASLAGLRREFVLGNGAQSESARYIRSFILAVNAGSTFAITHTVRDASGILKDYARRDAPHQRRAQWQVLDFAARFLAPDMARHIHRYLSQILEDGAVQEDARLILTGARALILTGQADEAREHLAKFYEQYPSSELMGDFPRDAAGLLIKIRELEEDCNLPDY